MESGRHVSMLCPVSFALVGMSHHVIAPASPCRTVTSLESSGRSQYQPPHRLPGMLGPLSPRSRESLSGLGGSQAESWNSGGNDVPGLTDMVEEVPKDAKICKVCEAPNPMICDHL